MCQWNYNYCFIHSGHGEELLGYWKDLDRNLNVMATQYYTALRDIEEQQEGEGARVKDMEHIVEEK